VVGLSPASTDATDTANELFIVDLEVEDEEKPVLRDERIDIGGAMGGADDMAMTRDGLKLYVANRADNTVTPVVINPNTAQPLSPISLPEEQLNENETLQHADPVRLRLRPDDSELLVLCGASQSIVRYTVRENGDLQQKGTLLLGSDPWDVAFSNETKAYVILENGVGELDLSGDNPQIEILDWDNTANGITLLMQP
jgi:YVTN family beta-propeller protein